LPSLALIVTAYGERGTRWLPEMRAAVADQTRQPDETWWMTEAIDPSMGYFDLPTPRDANGRPTVVPYSYAINYALDRTECDYIAYMTDDSWPHVEKFERMVAALDEHPEWGAVYCGQKRNGNDYQADRVVGDGYCVIDHTQVMHRRTADRWTLDMANVKLGDAHFWRALHASLGDFYPVSGGILDVTAQTPDGITARF
jgi:hypothetical protein